MPHNNEFPWSLIDGIQIHLDGDGHMFTFFDLLANAQAENMIASLRSKADETMNILRAIFMLEASVREIDPPEKGDQVDELFTLWVNERLRENLIVIDEQKAFWESHWQETYGNDK